MILGIFGLKFLTAAITTTVLMQAAGITPLNFLGLKIVYSHYSANNTEEMVATPEPPTP